MEAALSAEEKMFPVSWNEWYSTTWTLICSNWISPFVRGEFVLLWTLPHSCALASLWSAGPEPSPKGQVWGVKFNLKPDRVRGRGWVTSVQHIAQNQCECLYISVNVRGCMCLLVHSHMDMSIDDRPGSDCSSRAVRWLERTTVWSCIGPQSQLCNVYISTYLRLSFLS